MKIRYANKTNLLVLVCSLVWLSATAQLTNTGTYIHIPGGTFLNAQCDIVNNNQGINTGTVANDGIIISTGHVSNNGSFISGMQSELRLTGPAQNLNGTPPYNLNKLVVAGTGNKNLNTGVSIADELSFTDNKIVVNNHNLIVLPGASITGADFQKYVVTNGTGSLVVKSITPGNDVLFPVGDGVNSYKPVAINIAGASDTFAVRVVNGVFPADQTTVQKTYIIKKSVPSNNTATLTLGWNTADNGSLFQALQTLMWQSQTGIWTALSTPPGAQTNMPQTDWKYAATSVQFLSLAADSFILKSSAPPVINTHPQNQTVCEYGSVSYSVSATGMGVLSYQWQSNCSGTWVDLANGGTTPFYAGVNDSVLVLSNIPYTSNGCSFRCIVSNVAGTQISNSAGLTVYSAPYLAILGDTTLCQGDTTILSAQTTATSFAWNTGATTQGITVFPLMSQSYSVTVTDNNSCTAMASAFVDVTPSFSVALTSDFAPDHVFLAGQLITFTAKPSTCDNYTFFVNNASVQNGASAVYATTVAQNGNVITVTATINECESSDSLVVKVKPIANAFTPFDKNNKNDLFAKGVDLVVFNRWAQVLYTGTDGWDGTYEGKPVSYGTYFYIITLNKDKPDEQTITGVVTLLSKSIK